VLEGAHSLSSFDLTNCAARSCIVALAVMNRYAIDIPRGESDVLTREENDS
jgi:hypothetical protein